MQIDAVIETPYFIRVDPIPNTQYSSGYDGRRPLVLLTNSKFETQRIFKTELIQRNKNPLGKMDRAYVFWNVIVILYICFERWILFLS